MTAFSVGCVIVGENRDVISTGYSREWGDDWHAEAVALQKAQQKLIDLSRCTLYSSLEPCSVRKSGNGSCCQLILNHGILRVVFGLREPAIFVDGRGTEILSNAGIEVVELSCFSGEVKSINAHLFTGTDDRLRKTLIAKQCVHKS
jgi:diaminohydroxyphosphoribosylaminopyrimidine deaminase / 5-amino-6-(5-phosphoribosylamino)uracil reductase